MAHFGGKITIRQVKFSFSRTVPGGSGAFTAPSTQGGPQAGDVAGRPMAAAATQWPARPGGRPRSIALATVAPVPGMIGP